MNIKWRAVISILIGTIGYALTFYPDEIRKAPIVLQISLFILVSSAVFYSGNFFDFINEVRDNQRLRAKNRQLKLDKSKTSQELSELQRVVVNFLEHSEIYKKEIEHLLRLNSDYLCIIKSSEGLGEVFKLVKKEDQKKFPFGSALKNIAGSVEPFEHAGMFLIPLSSLPGITSNNVREYINKEIIPEVKKERKIFLENLPEEIAAKAEEFSYKYIAFFLKPESMIHETRNKKFKREFLSFIVSKQDDKNLERLKSQLEGTVKTKDILSLVDWSFFAKLTDDQKKLLDSAKDKINEKLQQAGFVKLSDFYLKTEDDFYKAIRPVCASQKMTKKKTENFSKKIVDSARSTVDVLRRNGVNL